MDSIKDIIPEVINNLTQKKMEETGKVNRVWDQVAAASAAFTRVEQYQDGILKVLVDSSARLYHFKLNRKRLLKSMKDDIPDIKDISFKIGKVS